MNQFITLPSGLRVNTAHILEYRELTPGKTVITQNVVRPTSNEDSILESVTEDMTAEQLDDLMRGPAIVTPVALADQIELGKPIEFLWEGKTKGGILKGVSDLSNGLHLIIESDGDHYAKSIQGHGVKKLSQ
jgi:hypothetical protein